jgi:transcription elongation factor GreA-like protein
MDIIPGRRTNLKRTFAMTQHFVPGNFVRHPDRPDWGLGQVQSVTAGRATVNFEHAGKRTIILAAVSLEIVTPDDKDPA